MCFLIPGVECRFISLMPFVNWCSKQCVALPVCEHERLVDPENTCQATEAQNAWVINQYQCN